MKVKFGVIGANPRLRANLVFNNFKRDKGELTAICDNDPSALEAFCQTYPDLAGAKQYADYRELVNLFRLSYFFLALGAFAPYLERLWLRFATPCASSTPRIMW